MKKEKCKQSLVSEIIADQKKEIEQLKKKLAEAKEDRNLFHEQSLTLILQMDIFNTAAKIDDISLLKMALGMMNGFYKRQIEMEQEEEANAEM